MSESAEIDNEYAETLSLASFQIKWYVDSVNEYITKEFSVTQMMLSCTSTNTFLVFIYK